MYIPVVRCHVDAYIVQLVLIMHFKCTNVFTNNEKGV